MTPAALQSKSSTLGPRARGDELGLTAVAFSLFICSHLHLGFAFRPSEHLLAQAVHEVARARTQGSTDSTRTPCTCARTMSRVQQQCPSPWMRHYLVALSPNPPKDTLQFLLCGPGEETGQHVPDHRLGRVQVRSGTVRGIFASLPERPRRSPSGFSSLASTRPAMNRFCQRSNVALVEIARQPDRQIVLVFDTSYQRQNLRLDQTRKDENPFLCETCHKRKNVRSNPGNFAANAGP